MVINGDTYGQNLASAQLWSSGSAATYGGYVVSDQRAANSSAAMWYHKGDSLSAAEWADITALKTNSHFTQMVSKVSTLLGCAVSQSGYTSANGYSNGFSVAYNYGNNQLKDSPVTPGLCPARIQSGIAERGQVQRAGHSVPDVYIYSVNLGSPK